MAAEEQKFTKIVPLLDHVKPENVKVSVNDNIMTVEVKTETKGDDGFWSSEGSMSQFSLPRHVDVNKVTSSWTPKGLKIEAPFLDKASLALSSKYSSLPEKWSIHVPVVKGIDPSKLRVSVHGNIMTIEAKSMTEAEKDENSSKVVQEFTSKITLPPTINADEITSTWTKEGSLKIEAPFKTSVN